MVGMVFRREATSTDYFFVRSSVSNKNVFSLIDYRFPEKVIVFISRKNNSID